MLARCLATLFLFVPVLCFAQGASPQADEAFFFSVKAIADDSHYFGQSDESFIPGYGGSVGYRWGHVALEYDYSRVDHTANIGEVVAKGLANAFGAGIEPEDELRFRVHNVFLNWHAGDNAYAKLKLGYSHQEITTSKSHRHLKDEETAAAGIELGLAAGPFTVALQHLWLGKDYQQAGLMLGLRF